MRDALLRVLVATALLALPPVAAATVEPGIGTCAPTIQCATLEITFDSGVGSGSVTTESVNGGPADQIDCVETLGSPSGTCSFQFEWPAGTGNLIVYGDATPATGSFACIQDTCQPEGVVPSLMWTLTNGTTTNDTDIAFGLGLRKLDVSVTGAGSGHVVALNGNSLDCPAVNCEVGDGYGASVELRAYLVEFSVFNGWSGACSGKAVTCTVVLTADTSVGADFEPYVAPTGTPSPTTEPTPTMQPTPTARPTSTAAHPTPIATQPAASGTPGATTPTASTPATPATTIEASAGGFGPSGEPSPVAGLPSGGVPGPAGTAEPSLSPVASTGSGDAGVPAAIGAGLAIVLVIGVAAAILGVRRRSVGSG